MVAFGTFQAVYGSIWANPKASEKSPIIRAPSSCPNLPSQFFWSQQARHTIASHFQRERITSEFLSSDLILNPSATCSGMRLGPM